jgi:hypothetical protein
VTYSGYSLHILSLPPKRCSNRGIVLAFEHEQRIRALIKVFADEKDPEKLKAIAAELERLLTLESKPWLIHDRQKRSS